MPPFRIRKFPSYYLRLLNGGCESPETIASGFARRSRVTEFGMTFTQHLEKTNRPATTCPATGAMRKLKTNSGR